MTTTTQDTTFTGDGWDCHALYDSGLLDTLRACSALEYELRHNTRRSCKFGDTFEDLKAYINELAEALQDRVAELADCD